MSSTVALFPLHLVVFPGSYYPLHIFEERYKILVTTTLETKNSFGIVLADKQDISKVGCLVEISDITKKYDDGKYDIIIRGLERYYILNSFLHPHNYLLARIEPYNDYNNETNPDLFLSVKDKFLSILRKINVELEPAFLSNLETTQYKSFKMAEKCGLKIEQQQELLSMKNENKRLYFLKDHLEYLNNFIDENKVTKKIVLGDGYINQIDKR